MPRSLTLHAALVYTPHQRKVIAGWSEGVATMKRGERSNFLLAPQKAYGAMGSPMGGIPPNTSLLFDIELLGWVGDGAPTAAAAAAAGGVQSAISSDASGANDIIASAREPNTAGARRHVKHEGRERDSRGSGDGDGGGGGGGAAKHAGAPKKDTANLCFVSVVAAVGMLMAIFAASYL
jgi:hypothetical protein